MAHFLTRLWRFKHSANGSTAVEFALLMPIFALLMTGILVFGLYFGMVHALQQLAAEAARASVAGLSEQERSSLAQQYISNSIQAYTFLEPDKLTITTQPNAAQSNLYEVRLRYDASQSPIWSIGGLIPVLPSPQIERSAIVQQGGY